MMAQALMVGLDVGIYGRLATRDHILELAALAESSGLESLWVADHVIFPVTLTSTYPYSATGAFPLDMTQEPLLEPWPPWVCWSGRPGGSRLAPRCW